MKFSLLSKSLCICPVILQSEISSDKMRNYRVAEVSTGVYFSLKLCHAKCGREHETLYTGFF